MIRGSPDVATRGDEKKVLLPAVPAKGGVKEAEPRTD